MGDAGQAVHVLVVEPRVEGHHLGYLKVIGEELLGDGYRLTLAVDTSAEPLAQIRATMPELVARVAIVSAVGRISLDRIAALLKEVGADLVFFPNLDEIGSAMLRRAAFGLLPPDVLRGRLGGIYHRPRFLGPLGWSPNQHLKAIGFARMLRGRFFSHLLLLDPYLHTRLKTGEPEAPAFFLPDFFPADFAVDRGAARRILAVPDGRRVFLFYGAGYRRKGLALAVEAMLALPNDVPAFLLCGGRHRAQGEVARGLEKLVGQGRAHVIDRYVTDEEEKTLFAASDFVLLPYRRHFGISGVWVRAMGAGLPVVVSDEELLGRLSRERGVGLAFAPGDADALRQTVERAALASPEVVAGWGKAVRAEAANWTRQAFRDVLVASFRQAAKTAGLHP